MRYDDEIESGDDRYHPNPVQCIALSLALIYYFRLPTAEDNLKRKDNKTPSRDALGVLLSEHIPNFVNIIQRELIKFVNTDNFVIPQGVAINQAVCICFAIISLRKIIFLFLHQDSGTYFFNNCQYCHSNTIVYCWCTRSVYLLFS